MTQHQKKTSENDIVRLGLELQARGFHVGEHPSFGGVKASAHVKNSKHLRREAIDFNYNLKVYTSREEDNRIDAVAHELERRKFGAIWNRGPGDHEYHGHAETYGDPVQYPERVQYKNAPRWPLVRVDGDLGPKTITAWQDALNTPQTGGISDKNSTLIEAVQRFLNTEARAHVLGIDGDLGPNTISQLQKYFGTPVTGKLSATNSTVVKALQAQLNAYGAMA